MGDGRRGRLIKASDRRIAVKLIREAVESGASLYKSCRVLGIHRKTYNRWTKLIDYKDGRTTRKDIKPANKLKEAERKRILEIMNTEEYSSKSPKQVVPMLADKGIYLASESTIYKILKEAEQLKHRGRTRKAEKRPISTHKAEQANEVWMWDITYLNAEIKGKYYYLYMFLDLYSRKIVGWEIYDKESSELSSELIKRIYRAEKVHMNKKPLVLHSDNGSPMKGATMLETLYSLGIIPSRSRPRVSNDNPYAESIFKTLKYTPKYSPKGFSNITEARLWVKHFVKWYNFEHLHSGINFVTPADRHAGKDEEILRKRKVVYEEAKKKHPERWAKEIRTWECSNIEWLNPEKKKDKKQGEMIS